MKNDLHLLLILSMFVQLKIEHDNAFKGGTLRVLLNNRSKGLPKGFRFNFLI